MRLDSSLSASIGYPTTDPAFACPPIIVLPRLPIIVLPACLPAGAARRPSHVSLDAVHQPVQPPVGVQLAGTKPDAPAQPKDSLALGAGVGGGQLGGRPRGGKQVRAGKPARIWGVQEGGEWRQIRVVTPLCLLPWQPMACSQHARLPAYVRLHAHQRAGLLAFVPAEGRSAFPARARTGVWCV